MRSGLGVFARVVSAIHLIRSISPSVTSSSKYTSQFIGLRTTVEIGCSQQQIDEFGRELRASKNVAFCKQVHAFIIAKSLFQDLFLGNILINMYGKFGEGEASWVLFERMQRKNVVSWTSMISTCIESGSGEEALDLFRQMLKGGVQPNSFTFVGILNACNGEEDLAEGKWIHSFILIWKANLGIVVCTALVSMYGKCGSVEDAKVIFHSLHQLDVILWTAMINIYVQYEYETAAFQLVSEMHQQGVIFDRVTYVSILELYSSPKLLPAAVLIHAKVVKNRIESDQVLANALLDMYGKCGNLEEVKRIFDKMNQHDVISWTALIAAYTDHGQGSKAIQLFHEMCVEGIRPNEVTYVNVLSSCAAMSFLQQGILIHADAKVRGFSDDMNVANTLINMYSKCGRVEQARHVFNNISISNLLAWNIMIGAYSDHGCASESLILFHKMNLQVLKPDRVTYVNILSACCHAGLVDEGLCYFTCMSRDHGITPTMEHFGCLLDLLGRSERVVQAEDLVARMLQPDSVAWNIFLSACKIHHEPI